MKQLRLWVRLGAGLVYIALMVVLFMAAKGHTILVDNKKDPAGAWPEYRFFDASLDGGKAKEFARGDRVEFKVAGQTHRIRVELEDGTVVERDFTLGLDQAMVVLNVPQMIAGIEPWLSDFVAPPRISGEEAAANRASEGSFVAPDAPTAP